MSRRPQFTPQRAVGSPAALAALEAQLRAERFDAFLNAVERGEEELLPAPGEQLQLFEPSAPPPSVR